MLVVRLFLLLILVALLAAHVRGVTTPQPQLSLAADLNAAATDDAATDDAAADDAAADDAAVDDAAADDDAAYDDAAYDDAAYDDAAGVPTKKPTIRPTHKPTNRPTNRPTNKPTNRPTMKPVTPATKKPTKPPSTKSPSTTKAPTKSPTNPSSKKSLFRVEVAYDKNPDEFSWKVKDKTTKTEVVSYPKKLGLAPKKIVRVRLHLTPGHNYKLTAKDRSGNGLIQGYILVEARNNGQWDQVGKLAGRYREKILEFAA